MKANLERENKTEGEQWMAIGCLGAWSPREAAETEVAHRDAATLLPIIPNHVKPWSIVYSDEWSAYNQLSAITGHIHRTVNHSLHVFHGSCHWCTHARCRRHVECM